MLLALQIQLNLQSSGIDPTPPTGQGDGDLVRHKGVKPIVRIRPKAERELDEVLELVESVSLSNRVKENKQAVKAALAVVKTINIDEIYAPALAQIEKALVKISRATAKHEGADIAAEQVAVEINNLVAAMEKRRKRQRREEEEVTIWLLNMTNNLSTLLG